MKMSQHPLTMLSLMVSSQLALGLQEKSQASTAEELMLIEPPSQSSLLSTKSKLTFLFAMVLTEFQEKTVRPLTREEREKPERLLLPSSRLTLDTTSLPALTETPLTASPHALNP